MRSHTIVTIVALAVTALPGIAAHEVAPTTSPAPALPLASASLAVAPSDDCRLVDVAGTPEDLADDIDVCRTRTWFHGPPEKVGNLQSLGLVSGPTFDDRPPASVASGTGSGQFAEWVLAAEELGAPGSVTFTGAYEGNIDNLAVTLYMLDVTHPRHLGLTHIYDAHVYVAVDGRTIYRTSGPSGDEIPLRAGAYCYIGPLNGCDPVKRIDLAIPDLLSDVDVDSAEPHTVEVSIAPACCTYDVVFVWDAAEVPSGLTFNVTEDELTAYTLLGD